jgi:hypothetical protein
MRLIYIIPLTLFLSFCSKPKTVLICGDHVCLNKTEAEQYFEENLSIEVKILDAKNKKELDLVELNINNKPQEKRSVSIESKKSTNKNVKILSKKDVTKIKEDIKKKKRQKKITKKFNDNKKEKNKALKEKTTKPKTNNSKSEQINVNKNLNEVVDVCTIIEKCSIDEISKYLLKIGKKKGFPDITTRQ